MCVKRNKVYYIHFQLVHIVLALKHVISDILSVRPSPGRLVSTVLLCTRQRRIVYKLYLASPRYVLSFFKSSVYLFTCLCRSSRMSAQGRQPFGVNRVKRHWLVFIFSHNSYEHVSAQIGAKKFSCNRNGMTRHNG